MFYIPDEVHESNSSSILEPHGHLTLSLAWKKHLFINGLMVIEWIVSIVYKHDKYRLNNTMASLYMYKFLIAPGFKLNLVTVYAYIWVYEHINIVEMSFNTPLRWIFLFVLVDFCFYWHHRAMHELNILWSVHQHHHSSEEMNLSAAVRQPYLQDTFTWIFYAPCALFVSPTPMMLCLGLSSFYQYFIHSAYFKNLGRPIEYIMNTPSHHRVHHGRNRDCIDKNYAGVFIIWDRMFGTFTAESEVDNIAYGLVSPINTFNTVKSQFDSVYKLIEKATFLQGFTNKLRALMYGPGWSPGKPRLGILSEVPKDKNPKHVYDINLPTWLKIYVCVHFVVFVYIKSSLSIVKYGTNGSNLAFVEGIVVIYTVFTVGSLMDGSKWSSILECGRCVFAVVSEVFIASLHVKHGVCEISLMSEIYIIFMFVSAIFWLYRILLYKSTFTHYKCTLTSCKICYIKSTAKS